MKICMRRAAVLAVASTLALVALASRATAQDDGSCSYEGRRYASGFAICQAGQVQMCVGGEWQGNGTFCDGTADGRPLGVPVLGPGQIDSAGVRAQGAPIQNAPIDDD